jgi:hypothetical protein
VFRYRNILHWSGLSLRSSVLTYPSLPADSADSAASVSRPEARHLVLRENGENVARRPIGPPRALPPNRPRTEIRSASARGPLGQERAMYKELRQQGHTRRRDSDGWWL